jgi:hypothetical protein
VLRVNNKMEEKEVVEEAACRRVDGLFKENPR